jgi:ketosteroid isomerase-like protein
MKWTGETASVTSAQADIESMLQTYETALNASDIDTVMTVFASDGVFMAPNSPSMIGADSIHAAYAGIFQTITFDTELQIEEIEQVATNWGIRPFKFSWVCDCARDRRARSRCQP